MEKEAQALNFPFLAEVSEEEPQERHVTLEVPEDTDVKETEKDGVKEISFKLDLVPGADNETIEVLEDEPVEVKEDPQPKDAWDWETLGSKGFLNWVQDRFKNIPKHSGQDLAGCLRAVSYCERLIAEVKKAVRRDFNREIDASKADEALSELYSAIERLEDRAKKLESKKFKVKQKKGELNAELVKTADTTTTGKIVIMVPYLISNVARACIDATVSGGRDMEECFEKMASEYKLDKREKSQVAQLIKDMGYPILLDRLNPFKPLTPSDNEVKEYNNQYYA